MGSHVVASVARRAGAALPLPLTWSISSGVLTVRHLRSVSVAMTAAGLVLLVTAGLFDVGATWALVGLLLAWAGVVKVVVVRLWRGLEGRETTDGGGH